MLALFLQILIFSKNSDNCNNIMIEAIVKFNRLYIFSHAYLSAKLTKYEDKDG
jgi:hypothetical protein